MEISIKEACHENWNDMTPNEQGAFCGKCVKTVIDFTDKSLEEIQSFFTAHAQESTCGRFEEKQLMVLSFDAFFERFRNFEFTKRFAVILFFTFGLCLFNASMAVAQSDSLVKGDTATTRSDPATPDSSTITSVLPVDEKIIWTMGVVSIIQPVESFDWSKIAVTPTVFFTEPVKKTAVRPVPLKRKPVNRRLE